MKSTSLLLKSELGLSENSVPLNPMVLRIIIPMKNGYFIGNIPNIFRQTQFCGWSNPSNPKILGFRFPDKRAQATPQPPAAAERHAATAPHSRKRSRSHRTEWRPEATTAARFAIAWSAVDGSFWNTKTGPFLNIQTNKNTGNSHFIQKFTGKMLQPRT